MKDRKLDLAKKQCVTLRKRQLAESYGSEYFSIDNVLHSYWLRFRFLEANFVTPKQQEEFLAPIIAMDAIGIDDEIEYRTKFEFEDTQEWLRDLGAAMQPSSIPDRVKRDNKLVRQIVAPSQNSYCQPAKIKAMGEVNDLLLVDDYEKAIKYLSSCRYSKEMGAWTALPEAWVELMRLADFKRAIDLFISCGAKYMTYGPQVNWFLKLQASLPWAKWSNEDPQYSEDAVTSLLVANRIVNRLPNGPFPNSVNLLFSIADLLWNIPPSIQHTSSRDNSIRNFVEEFLGQQKNGSESELERAAFNILRHLSARAQVRGFTDRVSRHVKENIEKPRPVPKHAPDRPFQLSIMPVYQLGCALVADFVEQKLPFDSFGDLVGFLWAFQRDNRKALHDHLKKNPQHSLHLLRFFVSMIKLQIKEYSTVARREILDFLARDYHGLSVLAEILHEKYWTTDWPNVVDRVNIAIAGNWGEKKLNNILAVTDLVILHSKKVPTALPTELENLFPILCAYSSNENTVIATRSAYSVLKYSKYISDEKAAQLATATLKRISVDPRARVRAAAAFCSAELSQFDRFPSFQEAAAEVNARLAEDPYALVRREHFSGVAIRANRERGED